MKRVVPLLFLLLPSYAFPFPEMVRHGYLSCVACHYNPNGGGLIRAFGRAIAQDVLSFAGSEGEADFAYSAVKLPEWIAMGGDIRVAQTYRDTPLSRDAKFFLMQADLEAAVEKGEWTLVGTLGRDGRDETIISRRHYAVYRPEKEPRLYLQAGKYLAPFGINTPDHIIATKRGLGWDQGSESYNVSAAWLDLKFDVFATAIFGRPGVTASESGFAIRPRLYLGSRASSGVSFFHGSTATESRQVFGPYASFGLSERIFILAEMDFQFRHFSSGAATEVGFADYLRFDVEILKGWHIFLTQDYLITDFSQTSTAQHSLGLGAQVFPRPHFEISASWQKVRINSLSEGYQDLGWLVFHLYL